MKFKVLILSVILLSILFTVQCSKEQDDINNIETNIETAKTTVIEENVDNEDNKDTQEDTEPEIINYEYYSFDKTIKGRKSKVFVLEIPKECDYELKPVLSFEVVFGYELLSDMVKREDAAAGVNGGFSYEYGRYGGVFFSEGIYYNWKTGQYPVFVHRDGEFEFIHSSRFKGAVRVGERDFVLHGINMPHEYMSNLIMYNSKYGNTDRIEGVHFAITVVNGKIEFSGEVSTEQKIPDDGYLLTFGAPYNVDDLKKVFLPGDKVEVRYQPYLTESDWAVECGDMLVEDSINVAPLISGWVGTLEGFDPRTAIGINEEGNPVLVVVDGRQPGYSVGVTANELAQIMIELGITNGALLDGGASSEMIIEGEISNRPSYKGQERPMAGAFVVIKK